MVCNASEGLRYTLINNNAEYEVSGIGTCSATYVVIPSTYNGKPVTSIGNHAFSNCHSLTSIEIPNSVTSIGSLAFWRCDSLQYNLQNGLKYLGNSTNKYLYLAGVENTAITTAKIDSNCRLIGYRAFYNRSSLTSIVIGDNVTSIGEEAFSYCSSLTNIIVDENNATYKSIDGNLYSKDGKTLIQYARGKSATSFTIPSSVTSIGDYAFSGYSSLTSIEIPNSVTSIGYRAFYYCDSLTSIEIPNSVTSIGYGAFSYCSSLTSIEIPDSVTSIGSDAFYHCSSLTSVVIGDSVTSIGVAAFWYCYSLTSIKYRGTASQWSAITKGEYWNYDTGNYTITYNYKGE